MKENLVSVLEIMQPIDYERYRKAMLVKFRERYQNDPEFRKKIDSYRA